MIFTLPRKISYLAGEAVVPSSMPMCKISPVIGGALIYNLRGKQIGQIFKTPRGMTVTLADGGSQEIIKSGNGAKIAKIPLSEKEKAEIKKTDAEKAVTSEFILFGNINTAQYEIFEKKPLTIKPKSVIQVVAHPLNDMLINVKVAEGMNIIRAILLCLAMGYLADEQKN